MEQNQDVHGAHGISTVQGLMERGPFPSPREGVARRPAPGRRRGRVHAAQYEATLGMRRIRDGNKNAGPYAPGAIRRGFALPRKEQQIILSSLAGMRPRIFRHERDRVWVVVTPSAAQMRDAQGSGENAVRESVDNGADSWMESNIDLSDGSGDELGLRVLAVRPLNVWK